MISLVLLQLLVLASFNDAPITTYGVDAAELPVSEQGQFTARRMAETLVVDRVRGLYSGSAVVVGSQWCAPELAVPSGTATTSTLVVASCFETTLEADLPVVGGDCVVLDQPGRIEYRWTKKPSCDNPDWDDLGLVDDRYVLDVVAYEGLGGEFYFPLEDVAQRFLSPGPVGSFPADFVIPPSNSAAALQDVYGRLVTGGGQFVAFPRDWDTRFSSPDLDATPVSGSVPCDQVFWTFGESATIRFVRFDDSQGFQPIPIGEVRPVTPDEATSLEVVAIYSPPPPGTDTHGPPLELMAIARDGTGERLIGVETQWEVTEGRLWLHHLGGLFGGEAPPDRSRIRIGESCTPNRNEATRRATVVARVGDLEKSLELEWTVSSLHTPEPYDPDAAERYCEGPGDSSQGCRVGGAAPSWAWLVLGLAAMYGLGSPRRRSLRPGHWDRTR